MHELLLLLTLGLLEGCKLKVTLLHLRKGILSRLQKILQERGIEGLITDVATAQEIH